MRLPTLCLALLFAFTGLLPAAEAPSVPKAPDGLVVLTFDDSVASHATYVAPLLKKHGFGATFYITEGFEFLKDKEHYLTWEQIKALHVAGFEIGNHTKAHKAVSGQKPADIAADLEHIEKRCLENGIPVPTTFSYPGYATSPAASEVLRSRGYLLARAGGARVFDPAKDDPLTLPQAFDSKPDSTMEQFKAAIAQARDEHRPGEVCRLHAGAEGLRLQGRRPARPCPLPPAAQEVAARRQRGLVAVVPVGRN
ncbi:MAG: hypothetical protein CAK89_03685 [Opitutia bacterium AMD-G3]|nr:MAG: hypothetical protein CAK89_03685 [Opitutae bacterium AMD-G3]